MQANLTYAVVLAGGSGTRFWPKSRLKEPKQLCKIGSSDQTMIEITLDRLDGFIPSERRIIVTHCEQLEKTKQIVGAKAKYFIAEPEAKNTAAALTLAALEIESIANTQAASMISFHADHIIGDRDQFIGSLRQALDSAQLEKLILLGITPSAPETGYGYIERGALLEGTSAFQVKNFKEKPDLATAERYLESGNFFWNSGIFTWRLSTFLKEMSEYLPRTLELTRNLMEKEGCLFSQMSAETIARTYAQLQNIAIDHAVLELSKKTAFVVGQFDWKDVGSWQALSECFGSDENGNLAFGNTLLVESKNCTLDSDGPFVVALGVEELVIVAAKNAILVCPKQKSQEVKRIVEALKKEERFDLV